MFDPSKMNFDLENQDKSNEKEINKNYNSFKKKIDILDDSENSNVLNEKKSLVELDKTQKHTTTKEENITENSIEIAPKEEKEDIFDSEVSIDKSNKNEVTISDEEKINNKKETVFDINIVSLEFLIKYLISKEYDFFILEPDDYKIKVIFKKDNIEKEVKYIKFPIYTNILLKAKALTKLKVEENSKSQEWVWEININKALFKIVSKTSPWIKWEKLFFKVIATKKASIKKKKEKMSFTKMMYIFTWLLFTTFILWGVFITIVLMNSSSVSDLQFFNNLGVDTNKIKNFAAFIVNLIFGFIIFVEIIFLFIFSYKTLLTKKEFKKQKINKMMISLLFLILAIITMLTWIFLAKKIQELKWLNYWKVEYFDNSKYISPLFTEEDSKLNVNENLIWPVTIRFNINEFIQKLLDEWFTPQKIIWDIEWDRIEKASNDYEFIYEFKNKWLSSVNLTIKWLDISSEENSIEKFIWTININNVVIIKEKKLDNGGSQFTFNANDLRHLWKIKWYYIPSLEWKDDNEINKIVSKSLSKSVLTKYEYNSKNIFEWEVYYWIKIITWWEEKEWLDKIFIISKWDNNNISWEIEMIKDEEYDRKYNFIFKNPRTKDWEAYITKYEWQIEDFDDDNESKIIRFEKDANLSDLELSSEQKYEFKKSWEHEIKLIITDSNNKKQIFIKKVIVKKQLALKTKLIFVMDNEELEYKKDIIYESNSNTYFLEDIWSPTILNLNARKIRALNSKYWLKEVSWDLDYDGNFETMWLTTSYKVHTEWNHSFKVKYTFFNRDLQTEEIDVIETVHIVSLEKEALLDLKIVKTNSYIPVIVTFDASESKVKWKDIDKFIFDYWDWTPPEERDWRNNWHKYIEHWDYMVKLKVVTKDWKEYFITKKLILKPTPQSAKIKSSFKKAPVGQVIDFTAENSIWEVWTYLWDFWDWKISTQLNPEHNYNKPWKYKVELTLEFTNKNILKDTLNIIIYKD